MQIKNDYRIVYDPSKDLLYIQPRRQGLYEGNLNGDAARLFLSIQQNAEDQEFLTRAYEDNREFLDQAFARGWIDEDLHLAGQIKTVETRHHLKSLQIETLLKCNLSCGYCYCSAGNNRTEILSKEAILEILDDPERLGVLSVDFTGGEFFLHPDWKLFVTHSAKIGLALSIHTNGMALTEANVQFLDEMGVHRVQITADGGDEASHNAVRGHKNAYQLMEAGIRRLMAHGIRPQINVMVHKRTKDNLKEIMGHFEDIGTHVNFYWIAPFGSEKNENIGITAAEYFEAVAPLRGKDDTLQMSRACGRDLGWQKTDYEPGCGIGHSYLFVTATGEFAICPTLTSREDPALFNGPNVRDCSLYKLWTDHPFFDKHRFVNCENVETCPAGTACRGGCRANAYAQFGGKMTAPNIIECNIRKNSTDKYVDFYQRYSEGNFEVV